MNEKNVQAQYRKYKAQSTTFHPITDLWYLVIPKSEAVQNLVELDAAEQATSVAYTGEGNKISLQ